MLPSPTDVVVGASVLDRAAQFMILFGFETEASAALPAQAARALYGLESPADEMLMVMPGAERGRVRLVATPNPPRDFAPFDARPFAIDLFCTDIEKSVALATEGGYHTSPITDHHFGPVTIREVEITGPDKLVMTLLEPTAGRRPTVLDKDPQRLHSEVHAFVWSDTEIDDILPFWEERGLRKSTDAILETPGLGALVGVPDEDVRMRLTVFDDDESRPIRVEFVEFIGKASTPQPSLPLAAGLHAPAFQVPDLEAAAEMLAPARMGEIVEVDTALHGKTRAATVLSPGGQLFEIWETS